MRQLKIRPIIFTSLTITTITLLGISLPFLSPLMVIAWPVPIIVLSIKEGGREGILATLLAGIVNTLILHPVIGIVTLLGFGLIGVVMGNAWAEGMDQKGVIVSGIATGLLSELVMGLISFQVFDVNPVESVVNEVKSLMTVQADIFSPDQIQYILNNLELLRQLYLGITACTIVIVVLASYHLTIYVLRKFDIEIEKGVPLSTLRFSPALTVVLVAGFFIPGNFILDNILVVVSFGLVLQGLSLFYFFLQKSKVTRLIWFGVLLLFFFLPLISMVFVILGVIDQLVNIRKRISGKDEV